MDGVQEFSKIIEKKKKSKSNPLCSLWVDGPRTTKDEALKCYTKFWEDEFLTDLTLLVGPDQVPFKVHRVVLAAHFEYFRSMFSAGLKESTLTEVPLPCIGPEDLRLILKYSYSGAANLNKENVFKMMLLANYFGSEDLLDRCCDLLKHFTDLENCVKLLEAAVQMNINKLRENCTLFIVDHLPEITKDDLSVLPIEPLLEIIQHPAAVLDNSDSEESEEKLYHLICGKIQCCSQDKKDEFVVKVLKAIHLPQTSKHFLFFLLKEFGHIPEARELIMKAGEKIHPFETREWYLERAKSTAEVKTSVRDKEIEVNDIATDDYSECVLIKGFPFYVYATSPSEEEKEYHVESPVAIEHLGLPYKVIVEFKQSAYFADWKTANIYQNGLAVKSSVRLNEDRDDEDITLRVTFE